MSTMGIFLSVCICVTVLIPEATQAAKGHCEGNTHWQCTVYPTTKEGGAWYDSKTGKWYNKSCRCQGPGGSNDAPGSYGHAEIHKSNVPVVKPSGGIGPMDARRRPAWNVPLAPMRSARSPVTFRRAPAF
jgi:hypothetical protein